ncbi:MAG: phosphoribosylformylglycinamidine synthase subunit PurL [Candidatus Latescibacterota bacterium]|nr:MAG: phosphoribosylformylglycinamidine synthase subunit PurL [Candidatus Latescibacterota bacterium]
MSELPRAGTIELRALQGAALHDTLRRLGLHLGEADVLRLLSRLERQPTTAELALLDSMWSEHCSYKSTRTLLRRLPTSGPHVVLGPGADAGVVRLPRIDAQGGVDLEGGSHCVAIAHESHNHPSQLLPFEGASTGIGGIVRDVYCMGADVIGVLDALRFGDVAGAQAESVQQIVRGVVDGIAHYGNALGVPNLGGEVEFDAAFDDNCLVNVVALGVLEADELIPSRAPQRAGDEGWVLLLVGKPTDDSGLGGASFASVILDTDEETQERGAVQLPDPFFKRVLTEANRDAVAYLRATGEAFAMKDLGAAGIGGATSEMAGQLGLTLDLDAVHRDRPDRPAAVLLVAETQERYALAVPEKHVGALRRIYEEKYELAHMVRGAGARVVGRFDRSGRFRATREGALHVDLPTAWVTEPDTVEWPRRARVARERRARPRPALEHRDLQADLVAVLASASGGSRRPLFAHYDSDVQGRTMLRPGDADAGVVVPWRDADLGLAIAVAGPARLGPGDAWRAGAAAVAEAARNVAAVGALPWALTDCLNFGSPENPECMHDLEECVRGLADAARAIALPGNPATPLPFVSGNVSLYNESRAGRAIPPTPIVACLGVLPDYARARGMTPQAPGDVLMYLASGSEALGASLYAEATGQHQLGQEDELPPLDLDLERRRLAALLDAHAEGMVRACRDVGAGGLIVTLAQMCFGRVGEVTCGIRCALPASTRQPLAALFSEVPGFVCALRAEDVARFEAACAARDVGVRRLGEVLAAPELRIEAAQRTWTFELAPLASVWLHALDPILHEEVSV